MATIEGLRTTYTDDTCVVCFKNADLFSVGPCDHPVCYECSTRMRVLCKQNECPICRSDMPEVIFTKDVKQFIVLSKECPSNLQDRKYGLRFFSLSIQREYQRLLEHSCQYCEESDNRRRYKTFQQLKDHMRREHERFYCDLCVENLKIFSFERKCYTRQELGQHRRKGDSDNTSHRGHPLCEFCDTRYVDSDELFRHLRRDHLYCHFCDADGKHQYYRTYEDLRGHFLEEHYLCEEGECKKEAFTSVFRTEIDYKAHVASVHSRHLSKAANRQARTLELEFTLTPRPRGSDHVKNQRWKSGDGQDEAEGAVGYDNSVDSNKTGSLMSENFPSLGNPAPLSRPTTSVTFTSKSGPLNPFSGEQFPVLGASSSSSNKTSAVTITSKLNPDYSKIGGGISRAPEVTITRTTRPSNSLNKNSQNFPVLAPPSTQSANSSTSTVRLCVNNSQNRSKPPNVSIHVNHKSNGAVTTVFSTETTASTQSFRNSQNKAFPALSSSTAAPPEPLWVAPKAKKNEQAKANKIAPAPSLPPSGLGDFPALSKNSSVGKNDKKTKKSSSVTVPVSNTWVNLNAFNSESKNDGAKEATQSVENSAETTITMVKAKSKKKKAKGDGVNNNNNNNNNNKQEEQLENITTKKRSELRINPINSVENEDFPALGLTKPPPGFNVKPPPGFNNLNDVSVVQNLANLHLTPACSNDLTFTNSTGQSYPIRPATKFYQPKNFSARNKNLIEQFMTVLNENQLIQEFKSYSDLFRNGFMSADKYYEHCKLVLGERFKEIFPELLVLLPDVEKQQELYRVHAAEGSTESLMTCENCKQIVLRNELKSHYSYHTLENNFPKLGKTVDGSNMWKK